MPFLRCLAVLLLCSCATPLHLRPVALTNGGRTLPNLFMGGWDGHRLDLVDDTSVEPGVTRTADLARALAKLSASDYGVIFVETAQLTADVTAPHSLFCPQAACAVVMDRNHGQELKDWGPAVAIFELTGPQNELVGSIWMDGGVIRPPGPKTWPSMCRNPTDPAVHVHPDGNAVFPIRASGSGVGFALFGNSDLAMQLRKDSYPALSDGSCLRELPPQIAPEPEPVKPTVAPAKPAPADESAPRKKSRRHRKKKDDD